MSTKTAIFPGSFDPVTKGHESVVIRALTLFDKVVVAVGKNFSKDAFFPLELRLKWLKKTFEPLGERIEVISFDILTTDLCKKVGAQHILRGLRNQIDFQYESNVAHVNFELSPDIESVFLLTKPEDSVISSSFVREILHFGGDISKFVPQAVAKEMKI
jgi:pantetheine-phosphate adenylyltransferase